MGLFTWFRDGVEWVISSATTFFQAIANKVTKHIDDVAAIELTMSKYAEEGRMPDFDEVVKPHSPGWVTQVLKPGKLMYDKLYKPQTEWFQNTFFKSPALTPAGAFGISLGLLPIGAAITVGGSALDAALEGISGAQGVGTGFGKIEALRALDTKLWGRLGFGAATVLAVQSPVRIGLMRNLDYFYNDKFKSQKLMLPQAYDGVRYREFLTESEWAGFEGDVELPKTIEEMSPGEISAWASKAAGAVDAVEVTNTERFREALKWLGYKDDDILLQDRAAKHAPSLMMLRQMVMRGFFDAKFIARSIFKGGFDNWAVKPMLNFLAYMAQEGTWRGYREASQSAFVKGLIDEAELRSILERIHVPKMLIEPVIATQKLKLVNTDRDLTTTQLINAYIKGVISREECKKELQGIGYTEELADTLIKTKESITQPSVRLPTLAQFSRAFREGIITEEDFKAYLDTRGYEAKHIDMLLAIEKGKFPTVKPKLTMSSLGRAFSEGIISEVVLDQRLKALGYSAEETSYIKLLYKSQSKLKAATLSKAEILGALKKGIIDFHEATERLIQMGYDLYDIEILFRLKLG